MLTVNWIGQAVISNLNFGEEHKSRLLHPRAAASCTITIARETHPRNTRSRVRVLTSDLLHSSILELETLLQLLFFFFLSFIRRTNWNTKQKVLFEQIGHSNTKKCRTPDKTPCTMHASQNETRRRDGQNLRVTVHSYPLFLFWMTSSTHPVTLFALWKDTDAPKSTPLTRAECSTAVSKSKKLDEHVPTTNAKIPSIVHLNCRALRGTVVVSILPRDRWGASDLLSQPVIVRRSRRVLFHTSATSKIAKTVQRSAEQLILSGSCRNTGTERKELLVSLFLTGGNSFHRSSFTINKIMQRTAHLGPTSIKRQPPSFWVRLYHMRTCTYNLQLV